jgi:very-short-patch-repair endonuclease
MTHTTPLVIAFVLIALVAVALVSRKKTAGANTTRAKPLMTKREQSMYWRLRETFPESVVLAQVAFAALITSAREHRNRYDRKIADFVLCDPSLNVKVVIELDDASHKGRDEQDATRDALLTSAGYTTLRFANVPDVAELRARLATFGTQDVPATSQKQRTAPPVAKSP